MRYRVDELAARSGISVDTVRYYQSKGLLPPPERAGRVAWYSEEHRERLARIRSLKEKGFTLSSIGRLLNGEHDPADAALVAAVAEPSAANLSLEDLAHQTGVSPALLQAIEREGLLHPHEVEGAPRYTTEDAAIVRAGLALLEAGLPLAELLALARKHDQAMRDVAREAVELFARYVRDPIRARATSEGEAAAELVKAFETMLPAVTSLVAQHFRRVVLEVAQERMTEELADDFEEA